MTYTKLLASLLLIISFSALANNGQTIRAKELKFNANDDEFSKLESQTQEIQNLLARIELLEHNVSELQHRLELIDKAVTERKTSTKVDHLPPAAATTTGTKDDVFDVSELSPKNSISKSEIPAGQEASIATEKKSYDLALAALKSGKLEQAEEQFSNFITLYPKSTLQSNAYFWHGETFFKRGMFEKAAISYLKGYKGSPKGVKAPDSLLKLALSLGELKKKPEACNMLLKLESEFPNRAATSIKRTKDAKIKFGCK